MISPLSPYRLNKAREAYNYFNIFNAISWNLLVGIIITLFALRMGATSTHIGLLGASVYVAFFMLPLGKMFASRYSIIGIFSTTWILRSISMIFAVLAPIFDYAGHRNLALLFILIGVFSFHLLRGIGMIGNNPVLNLLAAGPDRGSYLTQIQITSSAIGMFSNFVVAMTLGLDPPLFVFSILLTIGVVAGIISGRAMKKVPEPPRERDERKSKLLDIFKEAFFSKSTNDSSSYALRHFMYILFLVVLVSGVARTFVVVYAREVFEHNDGLISLYSVFGGLGFLMVGLLVKFLVDRLGAKPLFLVSVSMGLFSLLSVIILPIFALDYMTGAILFMFFLFFMLNFGFLGSEGIAQTYFMALVPQEKILDMSILYFFIFGIAGAGGTFFAGLFLDFLHLIGVSPFVSFKILFIVLAALVITALAMQKNMKPLGSLPLRDALEVIFSARDLRAISILDKLNKAEDSHEETQLIGALHDTPSRLMIDGLLDRTRSPRLATRLEAIRALEKIETLNKKAEKTLIDDVTSNPFTTAYISARILGNQNCYAAIPLLREQAASNDYMLAGESVISLAKMKDESFRAEMENIILNTQNPRLKIMGAEALGIYRNAESLSVLMEMLREKNPPPHLRDEVILAIAAIIEPQSRLSRKRDNVEAQKKFYKLLVRYKADNSLAATLAMDEVEAAMEFVKTALTKNKMSKTKISLAEVCAQKFQHAAELFIKETNGEEISQWILNFPESYSKNFNLIKTVLAEAVVDESLIIYKCLRLLIVHWAAQELRIWSVLVK